MQDAYAQALVTSVQSGKSARDAVSAVAEILKAKGRVQLMPRILRAARRMAERESLNRPRVYVAKTHDAKSAFAASGIAEADVIVDPTLIGGWRAENGQQLIDVSFKKMLLDIYNRAVTR